MTSDSIKVEVDEVLLPLIPDFLNNRKTDVHSLRKALTDGDIEQLRQLGHNLKGIGAGYGFQPISDLGEQIDDLARAGDTDPIPELIQKLDDYLSRVEVTNA